MINENTPVFDKSDEEKEANFMNKVKSVAKNVLAEEKAAQLAEEKLRNEEVSKESIKTKIDSIKDKVAKSEEDKSVSCPGCGKHKLHVHGNTAKCTGPDCKDEFLLVKKEQDDRNAFMCTTCGHTMTEKDALQLSEKDEPCPLCKKGNELLDIDWKILDKRKKNH